MGVEVELNGKSEEADIREEIGTVEVPAFEESEEKKVVLLPETECKGMEQVPLFGGDGEDVHVNITGSVCLGSGGKVVGEVAFQGLIDNECSSSSSFGDTVSGIESASGSEFSDSEVESQMSDDWSEPLLFRKKKVTDHWKRFIRPLMYRCKWIELQLKKLNSQALKYEKELAEYNYRKQLEFSKFTIDGFGVKSVPVSNSIRRNKVMKRKKRKRAEECDLSSYMSNHNIFSYYENKDGRHDACLEDFHSDPIAMPMTMKCNADNTEEFTMNDILSSLQCDDGDKSVNDILQKIEELQSQVGKLKNRIDYVIIENPGHFCSVSQLSLIGPSDGFNHSGHDSISLAGKENQFPVSFIQTSSQHKSELYMEDPLLTKNTLSTREGITCSIQTTNRPQLEVPLDNIKDEVLIENQAVKEERHDFENVNNQLLERTVGLIEEQKPIIPSEVSESDLIIENNVRNLRSTLKACSSLRSRNPTRYTRRGRKKSGPKSWSRR